VSTMQVKPGFRGKCGSISSFDVNAMWEQCRPSPLRLASNPSLSASFTYIEKWSALYVYVFSGFLIPTGTPTLSTDVRLGDIFGGDDAPAFGIHRVSPNMARHLSPKVLLYLISE
jgi:hypothetical protein